MSDTLTIDTLRGAYAKVKALVPIPPQLRFVENDHLTIGPFEDWSQVRSPGRAARRRKQGHPQRIRFYYKPDPKLLKLPDGTVVGHPVTLQVLRQALADKAAVKAKTAVDAAYFGNPW